MTDGSGIEAGPGDRPGDDLEIWKVALRRHWALLLVILVGTVLGAYVTVQFVLVELFETKASVLVKLGRENTELPATVQKGAVLTGGVRREELNSVIQLLSSRSLVTEVVDRIGLQAFRAPPLVPHTLQQKVTHWIRGTLRWAREQVAEGLIAVGLGRRLTEREQLILAIEGSLSVAAERESDVIRVRLRFPDPDVSVHVLNMLLELYLDRHVQVRRDLGLKDVFGGHVVARKR